MWKAFENELKLGAIPLLKTTSGRIWRKVQGPGRTIYGWIADTICRGSRTPTCFLTGVFSLGWFVNNPKLSDPNMNTWKWMLLRSMNIWKELWIWQEGRRHCFTKIVKVMMKNLMWGLNIITKEYAGRPYLARMASRLYMFSQLLFK